MCIKRFVKCIMKLFLVLSEMLKNGIEAVETGNTVKGIKGVSALFGMHWFDVVFGLVPDYMHGVLLGVTKKMLSLFLSPDGRKKPYFVGHKIKELDQRLVNMKPTDQVQRLPRPLEKDLHHLKASELQLWLLFYSIPSLCGILDEKYLDHLACMIEAIYILLGDNISEARLLHAENLLSVFYQNFADLYHESHLTLNIHNMGKHLCTYVRKLGPLWAWSCFPFEDMNGNILDSIHGTGDVCAQILWTVQAQKRVASKLDLISNPRIKAFVKTMTKTKRDVHVTLAVQNCAIAGGLSKCDLCEVLMGKLLTCLGGNAVVGKLSKVLRIVKGEIVFFSEEYTRLSKRIAHIVVTNPQCSLGIVSVKYFILHHASAKCFAVVQKMPIEENPLVHNTVSHLIRVGSPSACSDELSIISVEMLEEKVLYLRGNKDIVCIARLPNLYGQCC